MRSISPVQLSETGKWSNLRELEGSQILGKVCLLLSPAFAKALFLACFNDELSFEEKGLI